MGRHGQPIAGHPSKKAAVKAFWLEGLSLEAIAERCGMTTKAVSVALAVMRSAGEDLPHRSPGPKPAAPDNRGIWTPEKLQKAHRLFGKTMIIIAEALQVPAKELMEYGLRGVLPPMGKTQRVAALLADQSSEAVDPPEPSREEDEAELAEIEADDNEPEESVVLPPPVRPLPPVEPPARTAAGQAFHAVRLQRSDGAWLHESLDGFTPNLRYAWKGTTKHLAKVFELHPTYKELMPVSA